LKRCSNNNQIKYLKNIASPKKETQTSKETPARLPADRFTSRAVRIKNGLFYSKEVTDFGSI